MGRVGTLALTGLLAPVTMLARGLVGLGAAAAGFAVAGTARIGAMAVGLRMLTALGAGATLLALGGSLLALGRSVLLFPVMALRAIGLAMWALVANPVGLIIGGLVAALTALGVWVYNNWNGIKESFSGFGDGFMKGLGPAAGAVKSLADGMGSVVNWLGQLLGPLDESGSKWRSWGETVGGVVASGVNLVVSGVQRLIGLLGGLITKAGKVGNAIRNMFSSGGAVGGAAKAPFVGSSIAGARAMGGPVSYGKPYLVGERGPELFIPGATGRIETNNTLRRLTADGASAVAGSSNTTNRGSVSVTNNWTINGADDPRAVADQIDSRFSELMRRLETEQSSYLSD